MKTLHYYYEVKRSERKISIKKMYQHAVEHIECPNKLKEIQLDIIELFEMSL